MRLSRSERPARGLGSSGADHPEVPFPSERKRILFVLPFEMSARNVIRSPIADLLSERDDLDVTMVSRTPADAARLRALPGNPIGWAEMLRPFRRRDGIGGFLADLKFAAGFYLYVILAFRFNAIAGFHGFRDRLRQSLGLRWLAFREGLPSLRCLGWPFPSSRRLFHWLYRLQYAGWMKHRTVESLFDALCPDLVVLTHLQTGLVTPYVLAARCRRIPILGVNGSWDQPTTKGPLVPGLRHILAQSIRVQEELERHHGHDAGRTTVIGWPQMDGYAAGLSGCDRSRFLAHLGLPEGRRYVLVGAYSQRLGRHEPAMCAALADHLRGNLPEGGVTLYIRCHPLELDWRGRFGHLHDPPGVVVEPPAPGDLPHLANLLRHAAVVIASAGTINLDAAALDTPTIAVAFESENEPYYDRPARRYDMEHYAAVVRTGGVRLVRSQQELEDAVSAYLRDPDLDAAGRRHLRNQQLEPLDGRASQRFVDAVAAMTLHGAMR